MTNGKRMNEKIETRKCSNQACPLRRAHSGPCPPSDWKPAAPSKAQVEAACKAHEFTNAFGPERETRMRAALVAAAGAAPQAESGSRSRIIDLAEKWGDEKLGGYIARTSFMHGVRFALEVTASPVLPSSTVDEDAEELLHLAILIRNESIRFEHGDPDGLWSDMYPREQEAWMNVARAVVEAIGGESRGE